MATNTARLALRKPATTDSVDVTADISNNMDKVDAAAGLNICTSTTRPASPYQGQLIYETDTKNSYTWNGTAWKSMNTADSLQSNQNQDLTVGFGSGTVDAGISLNTGSSTGAIGAFVRFLKNSVERWRIYTPQNDPNLYIRDQSNGSNAITVVPAAAASNIAGVALATHHGFRNRLINSVGFPINQRNPGAVSTVGGYIVDRWFVSQLSTGVTQTFQQITPTMGSNPDVQDAKYIQWVRSVVGTTQPDNMSQRIESVKNLQGRYVTISIKANTASGSVDLNAGVIQNFGTGGSPSANVVTNAPGLLTFTTVVTTQTLTFLVPSVTSKTLGTNGDDYLELFLSRPLTGNTTGTLQIFAIQIEDGPVATPFEIRPIALELMMCQRYYVRFNATGTQSFLGTGGVCRGTTSGSVYIKFPVTMRAAPQLFGSSSTPANFSAYHAATTAFATGPLNSASNNSPDGAIVTFTVAAGLTAGNGCLILMTAATCYIDFSAEL